MAGTGVRERLDEENKIKREDWRHGGSDRFLHGSKRFSFHWCKVCSSSFGFQTSGFLNEECGGGHAPWVWSEDEKGRRQDSSSFSSSSVLCSFNSLPTDRNRVC